MLNLSCSNSFEEVECPMTHLAVSLKGNFHSKSFVWWMISDLVNNKVIPNSEVVNILLMAPLLLE
jgi:phage pi2 protein 07